jgi:hypothetical protein
MDVDRRQFLELPTGWALHSYARAFGEDRTIEAAELLTRAVQRAARASTESYPRVTDTPEIGWTCGYATQVGRSLFGRAVFGNAGQFDRRTNYVLQALAQGTGLIGGDIERLFFLREWLKKMVGNPSLRHWAVIAISTPMTVSTARKQSSLAYARSFHVHGFDTAADWEAPSLRFGLGPGKVTLELPHVDSLQLEASPDADRRARPARIRFSTTCRLPAWNVGSRGRLLTWVDQAESLVFPLDPTDEAIDRCKDTTPNRPANLELSDRSGRCIGARHPCLGIWMLDPTGFDFGWYQGLQLKVIFSPGGRLWAFDTVTRQMNHFLCVADLVRSTLHKLLVGSPAG